MRYAREDVLAKSAEEHLEGAHEVSESVIFWDPVVHWHLASLREQPEAWMAAAKQGRAQLGMLLKSWAATKAKVDAKATMAEVEKRILMVLSLIERIE